MNCCSSNKLRESVKALELIVQTPHSSSCETARGWKVFLWVQGWFSIIREFLCGKESLLSILYRNVDNNLYISISPSIISTSCYIISTSCYFLLCIRLLLVPSLVYVLLPLSSLLSNQLTENVVIGYLSWISRKSSAAFPILFLTNVDVALSLHPHPPATPPLSLPPSPAPTSTRDRSTDDTLSPRSVHGVCRADSGSRPVHSVRQKHV